MIKILIAEDSTTVQRVLTRLLTDEPDIEIVGIAADGVEAVHMCRELRPDLVTMDIFMPHMNGLEATRAIMAECPTRIVIISSMVNTPDTDYAFEAMRAGAINVIEKPVGLLAGKYQEIKTELLAIVHESLETRPAAQLSWLPSITTESPWKNNIIQQNSIQQNSIQQTPSNAPAPMVAPEVNQPIELICMGGSTGAPTVIVEILSQLPENYRIPIIVAQHISTGFAVKMAEWLNASMALNVKIADENAVPAAGQVLMCPDDRHLKFTDKGIIQLNKPDEINGHIPNIDMLFRSVADVYGASAVGVILSGMGKDGSEGLLALRQKQAFTLGQNEATSVVYGMNRVAFELGAVHTQQSPVGIANTLIELGKKQEA